MAPEILAWGGENVKSVINKDKKIIENLYKSLTPAQKEMLEISDCWRDIMKKRTKRILEKNQAQLNKKTIIVAKNKIYRF